MDNMRSFWQLGDELRGHNKVSEDHKWLMAASKLAEQTIRSRGERMNNHDFSRGSADLSPRDKFGGMNNHDFSRGAADLSPRDKFGFRDENKFENLNFKLMNLESNMHESYSKSSFTGNMYNMNALYPKSTENFLGNLAVSKSGITNHSNKEPNNKNDNNNVNNNEVANANDKRFKSLPVAEMLPRNEVLGGYIFVCNNDTMQENLKRQLFGLPPRYRDSVRAIMPGLPLFLYNYTTHQLHGIFEAASFGGSNIDPTAWEDNKCKGESRFPAQVRIRIRTLCKALEEDAFRPVLHHYDGPKFRLELSVSETLELLDLCEQAGV